MITYPLTAEGLEAALTALGDGSGDVATRLGELGIKGQMGHECACPIVHYIQRSVPDAEEVNVGQGEAFVRGIVRDDLELSYDARFHITFPDAVDDFIGDFDSGVYPELIEEASDVG